MDDNLKLRFKEMKRYFMAECIITFAVCLSLLSLIISIFLNYVYIFISLFIFTLCVLWKINFDKKIEKKSAEIKYSPLILTCSSTYSFECLINKFKKLSGDEKHISLSDNLHYFLFNSHFDSKCICYKTDNFIKKEFDNSKAKINKKANAFFNLSQWVSRRDFYTLMRFNVIFTSQMNAELNRLLSRSADQMLRRVEGVINIVIIDNQIMIPHLSLKGYGELKRYKGIIKFLEDVLLQ